MSDHCNARPPFLEPQVTWYLRIWFVQRLVFFFSPMIFKGASKGVSKGVSRGSADQGSVFCRSPKDHIFELPRYEFIIGHRSCIHNLSSCEYLSPQFKYTIFRIFIYILHFLRVYYKLTMWPAPSWLESSVGRALHRYRRGHGFKSCSRQNFFQP